MKHYNIRLTDNETGDAIHNISTDAVIFAADGGKHVHACFLSYANYQTDAELVFALERYLTELKNQYKEVNSIYQSIKNK